MDRRWWRGLRLVVLGVGLLIVASGCTFTVGCKTYTLFEPPTYELTVDESACAPPAVVPEVPLVALLPVLGIGMFIVGNRLRRVRR